MRIICVFMILHLLWHEALAIGGAREMRALHRTLFTDDYDPAVRPSLNYSQATEVTVSLYMLIVIDLETKRQLLHFKAFLRTEWTDELLQWKPEDHGNITDILVPEAHIRKPDMYLINTASEDIDYLGGEKVLASVTSKGLVRWEPGFTVTTSCRVDVSNYPFDITVCPIKVSAWMSDNKTVKLSWPSDPVSLEFMVPSGEYTITPAGAQLITDSYGIACKQFEFIMFGLRLARRPIYVILSIIFPVTILAVLSVVSFVMPPEAPEKVTVSMTVLLSFTVFLSVIDSSIPQNSEPLSALLVYVTALVGQSFLGVVGSVIVVVVSGWDEKEKSSNPEGCCYSSGMSKNFSHDLNSGNDGKDTNSKPDLEICNCNLERTQSSLRTRSRYDSVKSSPQSRQVGINCDHRRITFSRKETKTRAQRINNMLLLFNCVLLVLICVVGAAVLM